MQFVDTHCHLDDDQFDDIRPAVVQRAVQAGVTRMVTVGTTVPASQKCTRLARQYENVMAAVGIQPNYCAEAEPTDWDSIVTLSAEQEVVALGETGLDRYWDHTPLDIQRDYFDRHLRLSQRRDLPFIVHMRDCEEDILVVLREARSRGPLQGVMHSFTGTEATARECLELGLYLSFSGMVTYKKSTELRSVAAIVPDNRILIETDAPYLPPHPKRSQRPNEPALVVHTSASLAELRGVAPELFAEQTTTNACCLFRFSR
ncbi:MAG: TatD family hydrolase [Pirellulaceae bacterium]|nr:TatD family hydrolase [Pirellulaceae bacterium]MDP6722007.1 TatD family hydrolase [Pirellulaceae bacterium]